MKVSDRLNADAVAAPVMYSVAEFCIAHGISRAFFYKLHAEGKAPPICKLGSRSLISTELYGFSAVFAKTVVAI